jgi:hypothetical protein
MEYLLILEFLPMISTMLKTKYSCKMPSEKFYGQKNFCKSKEYYKVTTLAAILRSLLIGVSI